MKIGILYICTWKYDKFFDGFYKSSEKYFLNDWNKKNYYVFTDSIYLKNKYSSNSNIIFINQDRLWWPLDTLMRFWMFKKIEDQLIKEDFLLFINANTKILTEIKGSDFLPKKWKHNFLLCLHSRFYKYPSFVYPYERNPKSTAYIPYYKIWKYFYWWLNGWFTEYYLKFINESILNINKDFSLNFIAKWHDESHLNKFFLNRSDVKVLDSSYLYPEWSNLPFVPKILLYDKTKNNWINKLRYI